MMTDSEWEHAERRDPEREYITPDDRNSRWLIQLGAAIFIAWPLLLVGVTAHAISGWNESISGSREGPMNPGHQCNCGGGVQMKSLVPGSAKYTGPWEGPNPFTSRGGGNSRGGQRSDGLGGNGGVPGL